MKVKKVVLGVLVGILAALVVSAVVGSPGPGVMKAKEIALTGEQSDDGLYGVCKQDSEVRRCVFYSPKEKIVVVSEGYPTGLSGVLYYIEEKDVYAFEVYMFGQLMEQKVNIDRDTSEKAATEMMDDFLKMPSKPQVSI